MNVPKQWLVEITQKVDNLQMENISLRKQLGENTQLVRALEERCNCLSPANGPTVERKRPATPSRGRK